MAHREGGGGGGYVGLVLNAGREGLGDVGSREVAMIDRPQLGVQLVLAITI